jgi:hypothetical protein
MPVLLRSKCWSCGALAAAANIFLKVLTESLQPSVKRFPASERDTSAGILKIKSSEKGVAFAPVMPVAPRSSEVTQLKPDKLEQNNSHGNALTTGTLRKLSDFNKVLQRIALQSSSIMDRLGHHPPRVKSKCVKRGFCRSSWSIKS